uniref:Uncharacterized protein n=1 Tax=Steinernema glaseri TaxID=37863 RepID=A0A1I7YFN8_9BILA
MLMKEVLRRFTCNYQLFYCRQRDCLGSEFAYNSDRDLRLRDRGGTGRPASPRPGWQWTSFLWRSLEIELAASGAIWLCLGWILWCLQTVYRLPRCL